VLLVTDDIVAGWSLRLCGGLRCHGGRRFAEDPDRGVLEQVDDAAYPRVVARGAAGVGEVVSLDRWMYRRQPHAMRERSRGEPWDERDADAGGDELELDGEVGRLGHDVGLKPSGATRAFDHLGAGERGVDDNFAELKRILETPPL
jgi:hypothetical protein